jgi:uncharacterized membrane protein YeiH
MSVHTIHDRLLNVLILNFIGTFIFGLSGGVLAVRKRLDLFGVLVLAGAAALGGGIMRDTLLGSTPPATLTDWRYLAVAAAAGMLSFLQYSWIESWSGLIKVFDAAGLALFTVTGTSAALNAGIGQVPAAILGTLTGVGGGVLRDILAQEVPMVLRGEIYALASLIGAFIVILIRRAHLPIIPWDVFAAIATFAIRMVGLWCGWHLPIARSRIDSESERMGL